MAEVERAISAAGHVIVDMTDFPAADRVPAHLCAERVRGCDVYVGILSTRYGTPVQDMPEASYTELEFDMATRAGVDRLVFMLDTDAEDVGIPPSRLIDREFGHRQDAFRRRIQDSGLLTQSFANPAALGQLVERSLRELADTRQRISSGIQREQVPAEPRPVDASKFINPPPATAPTWFQGRRSETRLLAQYVSDPAIRMVSVVGRGGIGKTALVCRLLKGLEIGSIPDVAADSAKVTIGGIVYLSSNGTHRVEYPTLVEDLLRLLPADTAQRVNRIYQNPHHNPAKLMLALLESFQSDGPVVVLLDNLESIMDTQHEALAEGALHEALSAMLTAPAHAVTVIVTARVIPTDLLKVEPARQRQLRLEEGLSSLDSQTVLRKLDDDGHLGLRDAPDKVLDGLHQRTRGFPRALEAVKAILDSDDTLTPQDLLDRTHHLQEDHVIQVLVGEAYDLLDPPAQKVMQALSVYPAPVSAVGIDFLLQSVNPTTDAAPILTSLVRRQLVSFQDRLYDLHPIDREYARSQLPLGSPGDSPGAFTLTRLQARAADYYLQIRTPRESWRTLEDIRPQLAEFGLRCDAGDYNTAATVLRDIDSSYLNLWGHYRTLIELHGRIHGRVTDQKLNADHMLNLGWSCHRLGNYRKAIDLNTKALVIARTIGERQGEGAALGALGLCYYRLGNYDRAIELQSQGLAVVRAIGNRNAEASTLSNFGLCYYRLGNYDKAIELQTQSLTIARVVGNRRGVGVVLGNLGLSHLDLGNYDHAIDLFTQALAIAREVGDSNGEANALDYLGRAWLASGQVRRAVTLLDQSVRLADSTGDIEPAIMARSWLARAHLQLGDSAAALGAIAPKLELPYPTEEPTRRLIEGLALLELDRVDEAVQAFKTALTAADRLLAQSDRNLLSLQSRGLAMTGLAAITNDPTQVTQATQAMGTLAQSYTTTSALGIAADTRSLLAVIASHARSDIMAKLHNTPDRDG